MATESTLDGSEKNNASTTPTTTATNTIFIRNLVRPFTLVRLKELLERTGKLIEDQFWIDKIKSKCYATYEKTEDAITTREALNGISWPDANPKKLQVDFATSEELKYHLSLDKNPPSSKTSQSASPPQSATPSQSAPPTSTTSTSSRARTYSTKSDNVSDRKESSKKEISNEKFDAVIRRGKLEKSDPEASKDLKESNRQDRAERADREKRPIREWDKEKFSHDEQPSENASPIKKKRAISASPEAKKRRSRDTQPKEKDNKHKESHDLVHKEHESPAKLLDDLYRKTKATPCIYWLPLNEEQARKRAELRSRINRIEKQSPRRRTPPSYKRRTGYR